MEIFQEQNTKIYFSMDFNSATAIRQSPKKYWWNLETFLYDQFWYKYNHPDLWTDLANIEYHLQTPSGS